MDKLFYLSCRYHEAGAKAKAKVLELLRGLSSELQTKINVLVFASMLLVIAKALFAHVRFDMHIPELTSLHDLLTIGFTFTIC